jgi:hypothetical protein
MNRLLPLLLLPTLLAAATVAERTEADGLVSERLVVHRANDLRSADVRGWLQVRLGEHDDWLLLRLADLTEVRLSNRKESVLVWERPAPKERVLRREVIIPDEVMKVEAVRQLLAQHSP